MTQFVEYLQDLTYKGQFTNEEKQLNYIIEKCEKKAKNGLSSFTEEFVYSRNIEKLIDKGLKVQKINPSSTSNYAYLISWEK